MSGIDVSPAAAATWNLLRDLLQDLEVLDPEGSDALQELVRASGVRAGALRALRHLPLNRTLSMRDLAAQLGCDKAYATHIVDELERHAYVTRTVDQSNRRSKLIEVTSAGRAVAHEARLLHDRPPSMLTSLPETDLRALHELLRRVDDLGRSALAAPAAPDRAERRERPTSLGLRNLRRRGVTLQ